MNESIVVCGGCAKKFTWRGPVPAGAICLVCFERNRKDLAGE